MVPGVIAILLIFFPAILMAVGVVREKELGSITNLYATPVTRLEFLFGKQMPYVGIGMLNFFTLVAMAVFVFQVPLKAGCCRSQWARCSMSWAPPGWACSFPPSPRRSSRPSSAPLF